MRHARSMVLSVFLLALPGAATAASGPLDPDIGSGGIVSLLCKGVYLDKTQPEAPQERQTQFGVKLSYSDRYMELNASEWPALPPSSANPLIIRSVQFSHDDATVRAMFPTDRNQVRGTLLSMGLSKIADDYEGVIAIDRATGNFTYPGTTGQCEKAKPVENKF